MQLNTTTVIRNPLATNSCTALIPRGHSKYTIMEQLGGVGCRCPGDSGCNCGMGGGGGHSMSMSFQVGESVTILFDFWKTTDIGSLLGSIAVVFIMGVAYEALKYSREFLLLRHEKNGNAQEKMSMLSSTHAIQTGLHFVQFVLSYFLMLIFMTYNVWICMGVAFGVTVGYFFFGSERKSGRDSNECCH